MTKLAGYSVLLSVALATASGCGEELDHVGPFGEPYGEVGGVEEAQACDPEFGRTFVLDRMELMGFGEGYDLTGDGAPDNALAFLASLANPGWRQAINRGSAIYLFDFLPYPESVEDMSDDLRTIFYHGVDFDGDASNNLVGGGEFFVPDEQFDISCEATSEFEEVTFDGAQITVFTDAFRFFMDDVGTLEFSDLRMVLEVSADMTELHGTAGAIWSYCSLSRSPFPGEESGSFLDVMINGFQVDADIDRDGDGVELIMGDGDGVESCIDGDGTEILGPSCVCDPRIVDGYSLALEGWGVPAQIVGVIPTL